MDRAKLLVDLDAATRLGDVKEIARIVALLMGSAPVEDEARPGVH